MIRKHKIMVFISGLTLAVMLTALLDRFISLIAPTVPFLSRETSVGDEATFLDFDSNPRPNIAIQPVISEASTDFSRLKIGDSRFIYWFVSKDQKYLVLMFDHISDQWFRPVHHSTIFYVYDRTQKRLIAKFWHSMI